MKIIGLSSDRYSREYIAIVTHAEIEKVSDKRYGDTRLKELNVGDVFDLGAGCDFRDRIAEACRSMQTSIATFDSARATLTRFAAMVAARRCKSHRSAERRGCTAVNRSSIHRARTHYGRNGRYSQPTRHYYGHVGVPMCWGPNSRGRYVLHYTGRETTTPKSLAHGRWCS